jgi:DNA-binding transcriptional ArsR family regulator
MTRKAYPRDVFGKTAEPRRRAVISVLSDGGQIAVNEMVFRIKMGQPAVSKHTGALGRAGVVTAVRRGQHRLCRLNGEGLKPVHDWLKVFEHHWTRQVDQIKQRAERKALERLIRLDDAANQKKED